MSQREQYAMDLASTNETFGESGRESGREFEASENIEGFQESISKRQKALSEQVSSSMGDSPEIIQARSEAIDRINNAAKKAEDQLQKVVGVDTEALDAGRNGISANIETAPRMSTDRGTLRSAFRRSGGGSVEIPLSNIDTETLDAGWDDSDVNIPRTLDMEPEPKDLPKTLAMTLDMEPEPKDLPKTLDMPSETLTDVSGMELPVVPKVTIIDLGEGAVFQEKSEAPVVANIDSVDTIPAGPAEGYEKPYEHTSQLDNVSEKHKEPIPEAVSTSVGTKTLDAGWDDISADIEAVPRTSTDRRTLRGAFRRNGGGSVEIPLSNIDTKTLDAGWDDIDVNMARTLKGLGSEKEPGSVSETLLGHETLRGGFEAPAKPEALSTPVGTKTLDAGWDDIDVNMARTLKGLGPEKEPGSVSETLLGHETLRGGFEAPAELVEASVAERENEKTLKESRLEQEMDLISKTLTAGGALTLAKLLQKKGISKESWDRLDPNDRAQVEKIQKEIDLQQKRIEELKREKENIRLKGQAEVGYRQLSKESQTQMQDIDREIASIEALMLKNQNQQEKILQKLVSMENEKTLVDVRDEVKPDKIEEYLQQAPEPKSSWWKKHPRFRKVATGAGMLMGAGLVAGAWFGTKVIKKILRPFKIMEKITEKLGNGVYHIFNFLERSIVKGDPIGAVSDAVNGTRKFFDEQMKKVEGWIDKKPEKKS